MGRTARQARGACCGGARCLLVAGLPASRQGSRGCGTVQPTTRLGWLHGPYWQPVTEVQPGWKDVMIDGRPVVLVTGASGFIGRHLTPMLESNGWLVRQALRTASARPCGVFIPSIGSNTDWHDAVTGVDAVIHLAARVH